MSSSEPRPAVAILPEGWTPKAGADPIGREKHGLIGIVVLEDTKGDSRFLRIGIPVTLFRVQDMSKPVFSKTNARPLLHRLIRRTDISCHHPDRLWCFGQDHAS